MPAGTRLDVGDIIATVRQDDGSVEEAAGYLTIPPGAVRAAFAYHAEYKDEVDSELAARGRAAARERAHWEREQGSPAVSG